MHLHFHDARIFHEILLKTSYVLPRTTKISVILVDLVYYLLLRYLDFIGFFKYYKFVAIYKIFDKKKRTLKALILREINRSGTYFIVAHKKRIMFSDIKTDILVSLK